MAFTRATGKHRRPSRLTRTTAQFAGVAALTTTGVVGGLAAPALAADTAAPEQNGLTQAIAIGDSLADLIEAQASAQKKAADKAFAKAKAEAEARKRAEEAKREAAAKAA